MQELYEFASGLYQGSDPHEFRPRLCAEEEGEFRMRVEKFSIKGKGAFHFQCDLLCATARIMRRVEAPFASTIKNAPSIAYEPFGWIANRCQTKITAYIVPKGPAFQYQSIQGGGED